MRSINRHYLKVAFAGMLTLAFLGITTSAEAQDHKKGFHEWKANMQKKFSHWKESHPVSFKRHKAKNDSLFLGFLRKDWKEVHLFQGLKRDDKKKPKSIPHYTDEVPTKQSIKVYQGGQKVGIKNLHPILHTYDTLPTFPDVKHPPLTAYYMGQEISVRFDESLKVPMDVFSQVTVADYWSAMSETDYEVFVADLFIQRKKLELNDWAYYQVLWEMSKQVYPNDLNQQSLFVWYILLQSGYKAKLGLGGNEVFLMVATHQEIYHKIHYNFDDTPYYLMNREDLKRIRTYNESFSHNNAPLDLSFTHPIPWLDGQKTRNIHFAYKGKSYAFNFKYNPSYIDYFNNLPTVGVQWHFMGSPSPTLHNSIIEQLKPVVADMSKVDAANFLLALIQKGFPYKTDAEQFGVGVEKYFYIEEIFHYPYSDCEDRSILYAYLVKNLLNLHVVGLDYPGHIATSVEFDVEVDGDFVDVNGKKYIVCDPTYINAPIGMSLPQVRGYPATVIPIEGDM